jgi:hypothetical protein
MVNSFGTSRELGIGVITLVKSFNVTTMMKKMRLTELVKVHTTKDTKTRFSLQRIT